MEQPHGRPKPVDWTFQFTPWNSLAGHVLENCLLEHLTPLGLETSLKWKMQA